jgi:hypothetical protein
MTSICNSLQNRYLLLVIALSLGVTAAAQQTPVVQRTVVVDDNEPLTNKDKKVRFSPDAFLIGRDFHHNKFVNHEKVLQSMADCHLTVADAADPQNYALCEKLGLSVIVSEGPHLTGGDWLKLSDEQIDSYIKNMVHKAGKSKAIIG